MSAADDRYEFTLRALAALAIGTCALAAVVAAVNGYPNTALGCGFGAGHALIAADRTPFDSRRYVRRNLWLTVVCGVVGLLVRQWLMAGYFGFMAVCLLRMGRLAAHSSR